MSQDIMTRHAKPPEYAEVPPEVLQEFDRLGDSSYWQYLQPLKALVVGRTVLSWEIGEFRLHSVSG